MNKRKITPVLQAKNPDSPKIARVNTALPPPLANEIELVITKEMALNALTEGYIESPPFVIGQMTYSLLVAVTSTEDDSTTTELKLTPSIKVNVADATEWTLADVHVQLIIVNFSDFRKSLFYIHSNTFTSSDPNLSFAEISLTNDELLSPDSSGITLRLIAFSEAPVIYSLPTPLSSEKFSGLLNLGATCYLNGLIQSLFHLGKFREIVYAGNGSDDTGTTLHALQTVFFDLERSRNLGKSCACNPLVSAFGWDTLDVAVQQDVHELSRLLCDRVERDLKASGGDLEIAKLFQGKIENFIECIDVDYRSTKIETFYDLQLHLTDQHGNCLANITSALEQLTAVEILEGADAYDAEKFGKQRARKGVRIVEYPSVLQLQLMRFRYNVELGDFEKVNDRLEFPEKLALRGEEYSLHTVLVHSGGVNSGHYFSYINIDGHWFKFDDERVTAVDPHVAVSFNFGGPYTLLPGNYLSSVSSSPGSARTRESTVDNKPFSAYLLMYVRDDMKTVLLKQPVLSQVNPKLHASLVAALRRDLEIVILQPEDVEAIVKKSVFWDTRNFREIPSLNFRKFPEEATSDDFGLSDENLLFVLERCIEGPRFRRLRQGACVASLNSAVDPDTLVVLSMPDAKESTVLVLFKLFDPTTCTISTVHFCMLEMDDFMTELEQAVSKALDLHVSQVVLNGRVFLENVDGVTEVDLRDMHASFTIHDGLVFIIQHLDPTALDVLGFLENVRNTVTLTVTIHSLDGSAPVTFERHADLRTLVSAFFAIPEKKVAMFMEDPNCHDIPEMIGSVGSWNLADLIARSDYDSVFHCILMDDAPGTRLCVRFFNEAVEEVGMQVLTLNGDETLSDVKRMVRSLVDEPCRALEVFEGRIVHVYEESDFEFTPVGALACFGKSNFLYHSLRFEKSTQPGNTRLLCCQVKRAEICGHPFILDVGSEEEPMHALSRKLGLSDPTLWKLHVVGGTAEVERPTTRYATSRHLNIK